MPIHRLLVLGAITFPLLGQSVGSPTDELSKLSVEELFGLQVTSVGRKAQQMSKAPAAVFVLTSDDIRRSGATSIPEALRSVPGLTVLRVDGRSWVVSARGGARLYADKMLVMIDGRSLYNPLFSGLLWDSIDVSLPDVERIEIVRGPGAVMWGPNAVNGVINIITKKAQATRGVQAIASTGSERRGAFETRIGASLGDRWAYRLWGKAAYDTPAFDSAGYFNYGGKIVVRDGPIRNLDFGQTRLGFRVDGETGQRESWTAQGDIFKSDRQDVVAQAVLLPNEIRRETAHTDYEGGFVQAQWTHATQGGGESVLKVSFDRTQLDYPFVAGGFNDLTADWQKRMPVSERHELYVGGGFQQYWDSVAGRYFIRFDPVSSLFRGVNLVARDEWQVIPRQLMASFGMRADYTSYGHVEYQPSARLLYTPNARQSLWLSASRAVRLPSRYERDMHASAAYVQTPWGVPLEMNFDGSRSIRSEIERSLEVGYRRQSGQRWSVDVSGFLSRYTRMRALSGPAIPPVIWTGERLIAQTQMVEGNYGIGRCYGAEAWGYLQLMPRWRLIPAYSYLKEDRWLPPLGARSYDWDSELASIAHQGSLRSQWDLTEHLQFDVTAVARTRNLGMQLPGSVTVDARLGWRPRRWGEVSFALHNLTDRRVVEAYNEGPVPAIPLRRELAIQWVQRF